MKIKMRFRRRQAAETVCLGTERRWNCALNTSDTECAPVVALAHTEIVHWTHLTQSVLQWRHWHTLKLCTEHIWHRMCSSSGSGTLKLCTEHIWHRMCSSGGTGTHWNCALNTSDTECTPVVALAHTASVLHNWLAAQETIVLTRRCSWLSSVPSPVTAVRTVSKMSQCAVTTPHSNFDGLLVPLPSCLISLVTV